MRRYAYGLRPLLTYWLAAALLVSMGSAAYAQTTVPISVVHRAAARAGASRSAAPRLAAMTVRPSMPPTPTLTTVTQPSAYEQLQADLNALIGSSGAQVGISLQELSGKGRQTLNLNGSQGFYAASEYKLPLLMAEAQQVAGGQVSPADSLCYDPGDGEDGWFQDYEPGSCFSRAELVARTGLYSDNTAARILVRYLGGPGALNNFARGAGMVSSSLWDPNTTTANDLTAIWVNEALGQLGGQAAQGWLYPNLTHTAAEAGIPAGVPAGTRVVHKTGDMYGTVNDAADVNNGSVHYVLAICVAGLDEASGWNLIQRISARAWQYEAGRPDYTAPVVARPAPKLRDLRH